MKRMVNLGRYQGMSVQLIDLEYLLVYGRSREKKIASYCLDLFNVGEVNEDNSEEWVTFYHSGLAEYFERADWILYEDEIKGLSADDLAILYNRKMTEYVGTWSYKLGYVSRDISTRVKEIFRTNLDLAEATSRLFASSLTKKQEYVLKTIGYWYLDKQGKEQEEQKQVADGKGYTLVNTLR